YIVYKVMLLNIVFCIVLEYSTLYAIFHIITGLGIIFSGFSGSVFTGFLMFIGGFIAFAIGVLFSRIYCELLIVTFKILNKLTSIDDKLSASNDQETL